VLRKGSIVLGVMIGLCLFGIAFVGVEGYEVEVSRLLKINPYSMAGGYEWSPGGKKLAFNDYYNGYDGQGVYIWDSDYPDKLIRIEKGEKNKRPVWSPNGSKVAYFQMMLGGSSISIISAIYVVDADGSNSTELIWAPAYTVDSELIELGNPAWSPDGETIAFVVEEIRGNKEENNIWLIDLDPGKQIKVVGKKAFFDTVRRTVMLDVFDLEGKAKRLIGVVGELSGSFYGSHAYRWSPDGKKISYITRDGGLWLFDINTSENKQVTSGVKHFSQHFGWSPDGSRFVYVSGNNLWIANREGNNPTVLVRSKAVIDYLKWSFDSKKIAYISDGSIWTVEIDSRGTEQLTKDQYCDTLDWSPDGAKIVYMVNGDKDSKDGRYDIWVMNSDGSGKKLLIANGSYPLWSPDGTKIAFGRPGERYISHVWVAFLKKR
jgi:Tol biopolymer transport system component